MRKMKMRGKRRERKNRRKMMNEKDEKCQNRK